MVYYKHTDDDGDLSIFASLGEVLIACSKGHYWLLQLQEKKQQEVLTSHTTVEAPKLDVKGEIGGSGIAILNLFDKALSSYESPEIRKSRLETVANRFGPQCREALGLDVN
jgi:hypothetical protein